MTYLAILKDNSTRGNYVFAAESIPQILKATFDCILDESGFKSDELEIREYEEFDNVLESINSSGEYTICNKEFKYESFYLVIYTPDAFKLI